jgi:hypothetical protein
MAIMRKSSFERSLINFHLNMNWDMALLIKIEGAKKVVKSIQQKRSIFEAFVLRICAYWENLVENLSIDCLNKDTSRYTEYTGFRLPTHIPRETCKAILLGIGYTDFKNVGYLKQTSKKILVDHCNPFIQIPSSNARRIDEFFIMRNYLAHYSPAAKRRLWNMYQNVYKMNKFVEPGVFLLAKDKKESLPRMGVYINNFKFTANAMVKFLGVPWLQEKVFI